jgi:hypothetical protein
MAGLAGYYNPEINGNPYCESCGSRHWSTLDNYATAKPSSAQNVVWSKERMSAASKFGSAQPVHASALANERKSRSH